MSWNSGEYVKISDAVNQAFPGADQATLNKIIKDAETQYSLLPTGGQNDTEEGLTNFVNQLALNPGAISATAAQAFANQQQQNNQSQLATAIAPGSALYNAYYGTGAGAGTATSAGGIIGTEEQAAQTALQPSLTQANQTLSDTLASRGLSQSGALAGGQAENNQNYANALNNAFSSIQAQGAQNLENQAAGTTVNPNYQAVTAQQQQTLENQNASNAATNNSNGWSWLTPVASAIGTIAGGPIGGAIGGLAGSIFGGGATQQQAPTQQLAASNIYNPYGVNTLPTLQKPSFNWEVS